MTMETWWLERLLPLGASLHCVLLLDRVPLEEPLGTPLPNTLKIR